MNHLLLMQDDFATHNKRDYKLFSKGRRKKTPGDQVLQVWALPPQSPAKLG